MNTLGQDVRCAARSLLRSRGILIAGTLSLALGVAASTAIFSLIRAAYLTPIPGSAAGPIVRIYAGASGADRDDPKRYGPSSMPEVTDYQTRTGVFAGVVAEAHFGGTLGTNGAAGAFNGALVSGDYFTFLRVRPAIGRLIVAGDDRARGGSSAVVLSYAFWQRQYGGARSAIGEVVVLNGHPFTIVGVAPQDFHGSTFAEAPEVWVPISSQQEAFGTPWIIDYRDARIFTVLGRLRPGVGIAEAQAALGNLTRQLQHDFPETNTSRVALVEPSPSIAGAYEQAKYHLDRLIGLLMGVVLLLHVVAVVSVANLLVGRVAARRREIAIRLSLGVSRGRLVRQFLVEGLLLSMAGLAIGIVLARWGLVALREIPFLHAADLQLGGLVLGFAILLAVVTGAVFGIVQSLQVRDIHLSRALREVSGTGSRRQGVTRNALVVTQLALSLALITGTALLLRSMRALLAADPGYELEQVLVGKVALSKMPNFELHSMSSYDQLLGQLSAVPGVVGVSSANIEMMTSADPRVLTSIPDYVPGPGEDMHIGFDRVGPDYFTTLGIPLVRGRGLTLEDGPGTPDRTVVNEAMARRFWPGSDPIGRQVELNGTYLEVIGVAADVAFDDLRSMHVPRYYTALRQFSAGGLSYAPMQQVLYIRVEGSPYAMARALRQAMREAAPGIGPIDFHPLAVDRDRTVRPTMTITAYLAVLGGIAVFLAAIGLYGVVAYAVAQRTKEIGVRIALGATPAGILTLVLRDAGRLLAIGLALGTIGTLAARHMVSAFVYGITTADPASFASAAFLLLAVALIASLAPALRASRVDPLDALRVD